MDKASSSSSSPATALGWFAVARQAFLWCLLVKAIWFLADPDFYFYIGDSNEYLKTATEGYIPNERSWVFGHVVRWVTLPAGNIYALVFIQVLALALCGGIIAGVGVAFLGVGRRIAIALAVLAANSPLQLLAERAILTEALGMLALCLLLATSLWCVLRRSYLALVLAILLGVIALSLRLAFLPISLLLAVLLPVLGWWTLRWKGMFVPLAVSLILTLGLHVGYRQLTGSVANKPPSYQYADGWFMLIAWIGAVEPDCAPTPEMRELIETSSVELHPAKRTSLMWTREGLRYRGFERFGEVESNHLAKRTAIRTLLRHPVQILWEKPRESVGYFCGPGPKGSKATLREDLNSMHSTPESADLQPEYIERMEEHFHVARMDEIVRRRSPVKRYYETVTPWLCRGLLLVPFLLLAAVQLAAVRERWTRYRGLLLLAAVGGCYVALVLVLCVQSAFRLLIPMEPLLLLGIMGLVGRPAPSDSVPEESPSAP